MSSNKSKLSTRETSMRPFVYSRPSISSISIRLLILLSIQVVMLAVTKSFDSLYVVLTAVLGSLCAASLNYLIYKEPPYHAITIVIQGMIIGLLLPANYPIVVVFMLTFGCIFTARSIIFHGVNSWINVSAVAVLIAWFVGKIYFPQFLITSDLLTVRNPSVYLIQNGVFPVYNFDRAFISFMNTRVFSLFHVTVPEGFISLLWDNQSVIPAFRFNILTLISSIIIFADKSFSELIPTLFLIVYALLVRLFAPLINGGAFNQGDIILALLSSGTLFCAFFMLQWFGTNPVTLPGKIIYGILSGVVYFAVTGCGTSPIGMVYTVVIMNVFNLIIRAIEERKNTMIFENVAATHPPVVSEVK